uniref:Uncharacterized protein n=1 Tax=Eutreptiella gymnastica TaxID=73025 RepID=A0A7S4D393_9EUGL
MGKGFDNGCDTSSGRMRAVMGTLVRKESILRSLDLGLGGAWCCQCFVDGLCWPGTSYTNRAAAGLLQVCSEIAWPPPVLVHCPVGGLHAVHHRVVVQRQKLSKEEGGAPVHACQPWHCLAVPY